MIFLYNVSIYFFTYLYSFYQTKYHHYYKWINKMLREMKKKKIWMYTFYYSYLAYCPW